MLSDTAPLVSCIMPTYNRREFIPNAIRYFLRQDYDNKELIIIDDGTDSISDLVPDSPRIRYYRLDQKITLGAKLNLACTYANGNIIANWDDDDWYAQRRLSYQVESLQQAQTDVCGINRLLYYDLYRQHAFQYIYPANQRVWLLGSSLCYTRDSWDRHRFAEIDVGMDGLFVWSMPPNRVTVLPDPTFSVHMIHNSNVSPKKTDGIWWHKYPVEEIEKVMGADWPLYNRNGAVSPEPVITPFIPHDIVNGYTKLQNVYACLVHEHEDCIIDLVRNLHYLDPEGIILLYNGGQQTGLIRSSFPYKKFNAYIHPSPVPAPWGYLHNFALHCMEYALEHFSFDTITIVDSDQLAVRGGFTDYISRFLSGRSSVGMLSSRQEQVIRDNTNIPPAIHAFREYELWRPFLKKFSEGESKFLHWTFWPSTVFTAHAARDLVKLFNTDEHLQQIMKESKIWATEEIVLPTLTRLLGYEIAQNPCSYDYVKYKVPHTIQDLEHAFHKHDVYWMHPVQRQYNDPVRNHARQRFGHYVDNNSRSSDNHSSAAMILTSALLNKVKQIEGWLDDQEADLLMSTAIKACIDLPASQAIVEIGSYQGKSTVLLGTVVKNYFPQGRVYAIDPHEGVVGAADQGLQSTPPTLVRFRQNIEAAGLSAVVETIKEFSFNVQWNKPISLLFIDGLHDYPNVARDFWHFVDWVKQGGYIAFHDYADYYPGVQAFVNEILAGGAYRKVQLANSLMVVQKI
jgi:glycosyltransferase involved in cell wall biosynthesis/predicted O-methyltransferase YrrM